MIVGVDFDNTIVCYDTVFYKAAREKNLVPESIPPTKAGVRDYLRSIDREDDWTELQGYIYGARMELATTFPGVIAFMRRAIDAGIQLRIVSHKTRHPYLGPIFDLHATAQNWLQSQGFFDPTVVGMSPEHVFFELTKDDKLRRIGSLGCTHFIDDLPELLDEPHFPASVNKLLFEPGDPRPVASNVRRMASWAQVEAFFFNRKEGPQ